MSGHPTKNLLILLRHGPYAGVRATEAIDVALVSGVFEQNTSVLFIGDGVWQLVADQNADALGVRSLSKMLGGLPEYDISQIYACADSLAERGLSTQALAVDAQPIPRNEMVTLIARQDLVVND